MQPLSEIPRIQRFQAFFDGHFRSLLFIKDISSDSVKQAGALDDPFKMYQAIIIHMRYTTQRHPQKWHSFSKRIMEGSDFGSQFCMT